MEKLLIKYQLSTDHFCNPQVIKLYQPITNTVANTLPTIQLIVKQ